MFPTFNIGPLAIQSNGLILLTGLWLGLWLADRLNKGHSSVSSDVIYNSVGFSLIAGLIGARLIYVLQNIQAFSSDLLSIFSLNYNLLDPWGGVVVGFLALIIYLQRSNTSILSYLDAITPLVATIFVAYPLANLAAGSGYGIPTELPWGIHLWGAQRHPTQIYQLILSSSLLVWLIIVLRAGEPQRSGSIFFIFLGLTSFGLIFIDTFRADQRLIYNNLRSGQTIAWLFLAGSLIALGFLHSHAKTPSTDNPGPQELLVGESDEIANRL